MYTEWKRRFSRVRRKECVFADRKYFEFGKFPIETHHRSVSGRPTVDKVELNFVCNSGKIYMQLIIHQSCARIM